jgi:transcriptional regulator with PAS, ATPase and Fis domain
MVNQIDSVNISNVISILESNLPEAEQEMRLSALCADLGEMCELYGAAASYYLSADQKPQAFEYLLKAAQKAHQVYRNEKAFELYTKTLELLEELPDEYKQHIVKIEEAVGDVAVQLAKYELAVNHYMVALQIAQSKEEQSVFYRKLGEVYEKQADYEQALSYLKMGLNLLSDVPSKEHARIYNDIGVIHFQKSEYPKAEQQFNQVLEILSDVPDDDTLELVYKNLGNVYYVQGRLSDAVKCYEKSLSLGERIGDIFTQAKVYNNLGALFKKRGDLNKAIEYYQGSLNMKEQIGDVAGLAPLYSNLGMLYSRQEDFTRAIEFCQRGVEFAEQVGNLSRIAQSYVNLGAVHAWQKQFKRAVVAYQKGLQIAERIGDIRVVASIYINLAEAYCGDGNLSAASEYYNRTLEVLKAVKIPEIQAQSHYVLGLIYSQQERWEEATESLNQASEMFEKIRNQDGVEISQEELGRAFLIQMNQKLAIQHELSSDGARLLVGRSKKFIEIGAVLAKVAKKDTSILICGETGTGKSMIAHFIHQTSNRKNGPWVEIDCSTLSENLLESELFGHERGAFTGAFSMKPGKFELADHGTIFLDEIGNMSHTLQTKLLRVIQEREFERVGGKETLKTDVRIITATNKNLQQLVEEGQFRKDLYYRINVVSITIPPLREREEDIPLLATHFVEKYSEKDGKNPIPTISDEALELLLKYQWPGNIRELENVIQLAVLMTNSDVILPEHLPEILRPKEKFEPPDISVGMTLEEMEIKLISKTLQHTNYNVTKSAKILGISRRTLQNKLKEYQISRP